MHSVLTCNAGGIYDAGFSLVFFHNSRTREWKGISLWPIELLEDKKLTKPISSRHANSAYECLTGAQFKPNIFMLDLKDSKGRTFMAIESTVEGGNYADHNLTIIRWEGVIPENILGLSMLDWCEQPYWIIDKNCCIIIPAAKATERCPKRGKHTFFLENDFEKGKSVFVY